MPEQQEVQPDIHTLLREAISSGNKEQLSMAISSWVNGLQTQEERVIANLASTHNADFLPFEGEGLRTTAWFNENGRPFSPGYAENSVVAAVYHPEVGIGGTHRSFLEEEDALTIASKAIRNPEFGRGLLETASTAKIWMILDSAKLNKVFQAAINVAIQYGFSLSPKIFSEPGVTMAVYGMNFLPPKQVKTFTKYASGITQRLLASRGLPPGNLAFNFDRLGKAAALLYGGENHPKYPLPTFINTPPSLLF